MSLGLVAALSAGACKKDAAKPADKPAAGAKAPGSAAAGSAAATPAPTGDAMVCCEFGGAKGTSTAALCEQSKGKVVPNDQCPGMK